LILITFCRWKTQLWDETPNDLPLGFDLPGKGTRTAFASGLADAIRKAADLAGLEVGFRDAQREERDTLVPEMAFACELPVWLSDDFDLVLRR
jgi:hypothetical protein